MYKALDNLTNESLREFLYLACGECLGEGMSRTTYRYALDDSKVIKIENSISHFQNVREWHIWQDNQYYDKVGKWLAPCRYISQSGVFLIMDYAENIRSSEIPLKIPSFMVDIKPENFGVLKDGRIVLRDYGTTIFNLNGRLVKTANR